MSKAHLARLSIWLASIAVAVPAIAHVIKISGDPAWGLLIAIVGMIAAGVLSERAFKHFATSEEIRADLEERVRNGD